MATPPVFKNLSKTHDAHSAYCSLAKAELRRHGYEISPGTLYPLLHSLEEQGYLASSRRVVGDRVRKYYAATEAGKQALDETLPKLRELVDEVLEGRGPTPLPEPLDENEEP